MVRVAFLAGFFLSAALCSASVISDRQAPASINDAIKSKGKK
jgi:hypothetical protein